VKILLNEQITDHAVGKKFNNKPQISTD